MKYIAILSVASLFLLPRISAADSDQSWKNICEQVASAPFPSADEPAKENLPSKESCALPDANYYGENKDYKKVRLCAFVEKETGGDEVFAGSAILMMLYANGYGVVKNIPLAEKLACSLSGAPAEMSGRMNHLERLKTEKHPSKPFDICDDITSGLMQGYCVSRDEEIAKRTRDRQFQTEISHWSSSEKEAFKTLEAAAKNFGEARSENEVDLSGTARGAFVVQERSIQERDFEESVWKLEKKKAPTYSAEQYKKEDEKLNSLYTAIQHRDNSVAWGTVNKYGIKKTQTAWLAYRDAWIAFAKIKYPGIASDSIAAWFTKKRNHMLNSFARD